MAEFLDAYKKPYKLHLGCGLVYLDDYINIDFVVPSSMRIDLIADVRKLPLPKDSCSEILSYHVVEHIKRPDVLPMFQHWFDLLQPGGKVAMELPDFDEVVHRYLLGNPDMVRHVFGNQDTEGQFHYWGYNFNRLKADLESVGFHAAVKLSPTDYHVADEPCFRLEAYKPEVSNES